MIRIGVGVALGSIGQTIAAVVPSNPELNPNPNVTEADGNFRLIAVDADYTAGGILATNNNNFSGRWLDQNAQVIQPGVDYVITYTVAGLVGGETGTRVAFGDANLNNSPGSGRLQKFGQDNLGSGTFTETILADGSTTLRHCGIYNLGGAVGNGHRCTFLSIKEA